ncbi:Na/Pi symporter [Nanoarchaeota archaeon]
MGWKTFKKVVLFLIVLYMFFVSINMMGVALKFMGKGFAEALIETTSNPFVGLLIGIVATSIIQSSSTTTSMVVGLVAGGGLTLSGAIPIVMGANIGTTVTNTIVSMGHITRKHEFKRAFAGATVHDFFNILAVIVLFPVEMATHVIEKSAVVLSGMFINVGGFKAFNPLKAMTAPAINLVGYLVKHPGFVLAVALVLLFISLVLVVKVMKSLIMGKVELFIDKFLFKNDFTSFTLGIFVTAAVQSSSVTTSLVVPLVGAGVLTVRKIFPFTLGSNIGTTITAMLAAMATLNPIAVTVAFSHLLFNIFGIVVLWPFKKIPISVAEWFGDIVSISKSNTVVFLIGYYMIYMVPLAYLLIK